MSDSERDAILALDVPIRLATIGPDGFPRITPLWFVWAEGAFYMTSVRGKRHLQDLERDQRSAICIDTEGLPGTDGVRPSRQINAHGFIELFEDRNGMWTRRITQKYVSGEVGQRRATRRAAMDRIVMRLVLKRLSAIGTS